MPIGEVPSWTGATSPTVVDGHAEVTWTARRTTNSMGRNRELALVLMGVAMLPLD
jgi:hypothetical protein